MKEEARGKTDLSGAFALELQHPEKPYLVRAIHQGVNYDRQVSAGKTISIDVADAAAEVQGITGGIEIIRAGTNGKLLHVSDMVEIRNDSNPPVTEASERTFAVYLPAHAEIDSVLAAGPENVATMISATPAGGVPGHYTVNFALRPGSTKFAFNYDLPYDGRAAFRTENMYPLQQLAVMIPPTMTFTSPSRAFQILPVGNDRYRVEAAEQVRSGTGPEFEISGYGALPSTQPPTQAPPKPPTSVLPVPSLSSPGSSETHARSASAIGVEPVSKLSAPPSRLQGWIVVTGAVLTIGTCGFVVWRRQRRGGNAKATIEGPAEQAGQTPAFLAEALKEGLFQLESDRLRGAIHGEEYASAKRALEGTIEWALARAEARKGSTPAGIES
jgi:hypothetical protein